MINTKYLKKKKTYIATDGTVPVRQAKIKESSRLIKT
jgi:hypothetical protein